MRKFLVALVFLLGLLFVFTKINELETIVNTLQRGDWRFLGLALLVEGFWLVNVSASYRSVYRALGIEEELKDLVLIAAAANFVNVVMPTAGVGGMTIFISEARRKNYSSGLATVASALYLLFDYAGFLCVLALGLIVLVRRDTLNTPDITASVIMLLIAVVLALLLYLGTHSERALGGVLAWTARGINKLVGLFQRHKEKSYLSEVRAYSFARDIAEGTRNLKTSPKNLLMPALLALSNKALLIAILFLVFVAFEVPISAGTLIAGVSIAFLFMVVSPTPSGIGFVEGALTLTLASFYIPLGEAAVVVVAFRAVTFWIPLLFGMLAFRWKEGTSSPGPDDDTIDIRRGRVDQP